MNKETRSILSHDLSSYPLYPVWIKNSFPIPTKLVISEERIGLRSVVQKLYNFYCLELFLEKMKLNMMQEVVNGVAPNRKKTEFVLTKWLYVNTAA